MNISILSILFGLGGKCVLNWALVFFQKDHIWRSLLGVFSLSLAAVDTILTLVVSFIYVQNDVQVIGLRLTRYHICLLVQVLGYIYSALHLCIVILTSLEHLCVISRRLHHGTFRTTWVCYVFLTCLMWGFTTFYVFKLSDLYPDLEDLPHYMINQCWIGNSSETFEVAIMLVLLFLCSITWYSLRYLIERLNNPHLNYQISIKSRICSRLIFIRRVAWIFQDTWAFFLIFLMLPVALPVEMPEYLGLNCAWLCFVNSLSIGVALCVVHPGFELAQDLAAIPPDSFCEWKIKFSLAPDVP